VNFHNVSLLGAPGLLHYPREAVTLYMAHEHWLVCPTHVLWRHRRERCDRRECIRCSLAYRRPPQLWRYGPALARGLRRIDAVIAMSEFSRAKHREFGLERDMEVLPCFLPDVAAPEEGPEPGRPQSRPYFFFAGRLERIKGLDDVIPVFKRFRDADLLIAGDGEHGPTLRALAADLPHVRFLGKLTPEALRAYYRHAIALLVPSVCFETFGLVLIEAFRQGTPVIARRLGPFPELLEQSGAGELFATAEELEAVLHRFLEQPGLRPALSSAGRSAFQSHWTEAAVVPAYLDIVSRAATRRGYARITDALTIPEVV
jgi:glycosyltransferase involved in cell wall biosynthesis